MPRIETVAGIAICIYGGDHNSPHFHARASGREVQIEIATLRIMEGSLEPNQLQTVLAWAKNNTAVLCAAWNRINP